MYLSTEYIASIIVGQGYHVQFSFTTLNLLFYDCFFVFESLLRDKVLECWCKFQMREITVVSAGEEMEAVLRITFNPPKTIFLAIM